MSIITARQCKAARQLLGWLQEDLATAADVGLSTIGNFEKDEKGLITRVALINQICKAFENAGIQFIEGGVRLRSEDARTYKGSNACDSFFDEILNEAKENDGDILAFIKSQDMLTKYSGDPRRTNLDRLKQLHETADVKCILADTRTPSFLMPSFEIRAVPKMAVGPTSFFVYGDKMAFISLDACRDLSILAVYEAPMAQEHRDVFMIFWDNALPLQTKASRAERHVDLRVSV